MLSKQITGACSYGHAVKHAKEKKTKTANVFALDIHFSSAVLLSVEAKVSKMGG